ncbi:hypothetical protein SAMN05421749_102406 [Acinetobacter marinus]|uniref:Lipoprotein n=1 Tax=Acinetobacter marinus TaxID=281375 RepID=A0A1G6HN33_9GAMM|nr:hypothetical protein SAMN05421749_102406 [Acinetobacter marinus]
MRLNQWLKVLVLLCCCASLSACISRLSRPELTGQIVDRAQQPIAQVKVGEGYSDENGYFTLPERRYYAFLLKEIMMMEAPAMGFSELVEKAGYQSCQISYHSNYGGGAPKGASMALGKIVLLKGKTTESPVPICETKYTTAK